MNMKSFDYNRLITLLRGCGDLAAVKFLGRIQENNYKYTLTKAIPANEVWDIYSRRKSWNESVSNPNHSLIIGYDQLMPRLPRENSRKVNVHSIKWAETSIVIFTDEETMEYFGLLIIPDKQVDSKHEP